MDAARVLRQARKRAGLTQRQLAAKAEVPQPQIARIESAGSIPRVDTLDRLLDVCGEGLEALPRPGIGVDHTMYPDLLALSPRERVVNAATVAKGVQSLLVAAKKVERPQDFDFLALLEKITTARVQFVVVGGVAAVIHGSNVVTRDLDLCCAWERGNLQRLIAVLREMDARLSTARTVRIQVDALLKRDGAAFETRFGSLDLHASPPDFLWDYDELERSAEDTDLGGLSVKVASLDDLIRMKRIAGRPADLWMVEELGALRDEIDARAAEERKRRRKRTWPRVVDSEHLFD